MNGTRQFWLDSMLKIATPVLDALSRQCLRKELPIESISPKEDRANYIYLEAFARVMVGIAPWLGSRALTGEEEALRQKYAALARRCLAVAVDPNSDDCMNFSYGDQPIVDAAFLAEGILRAPNELWDPLDAVTKARLLDAMRATRTRKPARCNWLLFGAMIECLLHHAGAPDWDPMRVDYALCKHEEWYKGDSVYGDGALFHWDYYNSFVIQPMLLDVLAEVKDFDAAWVQMEDRALQRAARYATYQEHLISPEGTYPLIGRSLCYRFGAFHTLAMMAWQHRLEETLSPAQVRCAMTAVMRRMLAMEGTFDADGWLRVGVCGHQPSMGEAYISTGSLYLCCEAFLPLALGEDDPFWKDPDAPWTMQQLWSGEDRLCEHTIWV